MKLKLEQVAVLVGVSAKTVNNWYWFKRQNPNNEWAKKLPEYEQETPRSTRYWDMDDIPMLIEFRATLPRGRNGILGEVTQKWARRQKFGGKKK